MSVAHSNDIDDCCCTNTIYDFEKERFKKAISEKNKQIEELEFELTHLRKVIETITIPKLKLT